jgi:hypothetical protein
MYKKVKSTLHTKVPSILFKDKHVLKVNKPTSGKLTKLNGPLKINQLPLIKQKFLKKLKKTVHWLKQVLTQLHQWAKLGKPSPSNKRLPPSKRTDLVIKIQ